MRRLLKRNPAGGRSEPMKFPRRYKTFCTGLLALAAAVVQVQAQVLSFDQAKQRADAGDAFAQAVVALDYQLSCSALTNCLPSVLHIVGSAFEQQPVQACSNGSALEETCPAIATPKTRDISPSLFRHGFVIIRVLPRP